MAESDVLYFRFEQQGDRILHKMNLLREQELFCDVCIYINESEFHGHKVVLAACSAFMRDQFLLNQSRQVHITILQNAEVGQKLLHSCYTGILEVKRNELLKYLTAASYLQMVHIVEKCTEALSRYIQSDACANPQTGAPQVKEASCESQSGRGDKDCEIIELSEDSQLNVDYQVKKEADEQAALRSPASDNDLSDMKIDYKESDICVFQMGSMAENPNPGDRDQFSQACTSSKSNMYFSDTQHSVINSTVENRLGDVPGGPYSSYQEGGPSSPGIMPGLQQGPAEGPCSWRHQCPKCPRGFLHLENYLRHLKMHKLFLCLQCGKTFTQKKNLNRHIRGHMGIRPFQCSICLKTFTAKSTLQDHLNIHSGDRPYKCHCCDMDFKHKSALKKHLTSVHGKGGGEKSGLDITKVTIDYD
ncbi:zinc finger and BTB domain-containing protein 6 [Gastrophryne carolinensis]